MENQIVNYYKLDRTCGRIEIENNELLYTYDGVMVFFDLDYMVEKIEQGFLLIIVDREHSFAYDDNIFETKAELEVRLSDIRETLEKISKLDKQLSTKRGNNKIC